MDKINVFGGAVLLLDIFGASGAESICTLNSLSSSEIGLLGVCGICNGGGGASA